MTELRTADLLAAYRAERGPTATEQDRLWTRVSADVDGVAREAADADVVPISSRWRVAAWVAVGLAAAAALVVWWPSGTSVDADSSSDADNLAPHASERDTVGGAAKTHVPEATAPRPRAGGVDESPQTDAPSPAPLEANPPPDAEPAATAADAAATAEATPRGPRAPKARPKSAKAEPAPSSATDSLAAETRQIQRARAQLSAGRAGVALQTLRDYADVYPKGRLAEEADAVKTMARCRMNPKDPIGLADAFDRRRANSLFSRQVRTACEAARKPATE